MSDQDRRRDLSKLRTVPLDDATHRRLRLHVHGLREEGEAGEALARVAALAINAWIDRQDGALPDVQATDDLRRMAEREAGDPSEGAGELYGRWRKP